MFGRIMNGSTQSLERTLQKSAKIPWKFSSKKKSKIGKEFNTRVCQFDDDNIHDYLSWQRLTSIYCFSLYHKKSQQQNQRNQRKMTVLHI